MISPGYLSFNDSLNNNKISQYLFPKTRAQNKTHKAGLFTYQIVECRHHECIWLFCTECIYVVTAADNPVIPGIARLYLADRAKHDELAAEWTRRFAK